MTYAYYFELDACLVRYMGLFTWVMGKAMLPMRAQYFVMAVIHWHMLMCIRPMPLLVDITDRPVFENGCYRS